MASRRGPHGGAEPRRPPRAGSFRRTSAPLAASLCGAPHANGTLQPPPPHTDVQRRTSQSSVLFLSSSDSYTGLLKPSTEMMEHKTACEIFAAEVHCKMAAGHGQGLAFRTASSCLGASKAHRCWERRCLEWLLDASLTSQVAAQSAKRGNVPWDCWSLPTAAVGGKLCCPPDSGLTRSSAGAGSSAGWRCRSAAVEGRGASFNAGPSGRGVLRAELLLGPAQNSPCGG